MFLPSPNHQIPYNYKSLVGLFEINREAVCLRILSSSLLLVLSLLTFGDHSNESVVDRHHTAKIEAAKKSLNFRVFTKAEDDVS